MRRSDSNPDRAVTLLSQLARAAEDGTARRGMSTKNKAAMGSDRVGSWGKLGLGLGLGGF